VKALAEAHSGLGRPVELVAFDVDGTLLQHPDGKVIWQVLNRAFVGDDGVNAERYRHFVQGRLSYPEWVALDIEGWRRAGATRDRILEVVEAELRPVPGARETLLELGRRGYGLAVISGTLDVGFDRFFSDLPFLGVYMNRIHFDQQGRIEGWQATDYDMSGKAEALRELACAQGLPLERCAFVGDHANDVEVTRAAGLGIAFNPRSDALVAVADRVVHAPELSAILPLLP
jgi:phosphoserine phosphatase